MPDNMTKDEILNALGEISKHFEDCAEQGDESLSELFHRWMNAADWAAAYLNDPAPTIGGWISVKDRLPEEKESMFAKFHATEMWSRAVWLKESETVLVGVAFPDGGQKVTVGKLRDGKWSTTVSQAIPHIVTHWMPLPEPPEEEDTNDDQHT